MVNSPNERNWRGIFIALLVIIAVLGLIVFSIVLVSPPEEGPRLRGRKPTLEEVLGKLPTPARFNGTWISGKKLKNALFSVLHGKNSGTFVKKVSRN